jgi:hypothetical protein
MSGGNYMKSSLRSKGKSKGEPSKYNLPDQWKWVLDVYDEAHLPQLALPVKWDSSKEKHALTAFNPETFDTFDIKNKKLISHATSPIGFIKATKGENPMPGTDAPASARYTRYLDDKFQSYCVEGAQGEILAPCMGPMVIMF